MKDCVSSHKNACVGGYTHLHSEKKKMKSNYFLCDLIFFRRKIEIIFPCGVFHCPVILIFRKTLPPRLSRELKCVIWLVVKWHGGSHAYFRCLWTSALINILEIYWFPPVVLVVVDLFCFYRTPKWWRPEMKEPVTSFAWRRFSSCLLFYSWWVIRDQLTARIREFDYQPTSLIFLFSRKCLTNVVFWKKANNSCTK